jgi:hypothetical protein
VLHLETVDSDLGELHDADIDAYAALAVLEEQAVLPSRTLVQERPQPLPKLLARRFPSMQHHKIAIDACLGGWAVT